MLRIRSRLGALAFFVGAGAVSAPREARATVGGGFGTGAFSLFLYNVCDPLGGTLFQCNRAGIRVDPAGDVTHVTLTLDYDFSGPNFVFNAALSGPLGPFSVGGSAPPATPGVGTQPLPIFTALPDTPGAPLPNWALSVVDNGLAVTVDYERVSGPPVNVPTETNFFLLVFDYITPVVVDASRTVVQYSTGILPGADFVQFDPLCEGPPDAPTCGSATPAVSIRIDVVPEPAVPVLVGTGLALAAALQRRRRQGA